MHLVSSTWRLDVYRQVFFSGVFQRVAAGSIAHGMAGAEDRHCSAVSPWDADLDAVVVEYNGVLHSGGGGSPSKQTRILVGKIAFGSARRDVQ